jgi:hypothetical protein
MKGRIVPSVPFWAAIVVLAFLWACSSPPDEAWFRITGFFDADLGSVTVVQSDIDDNTADLVDMELTNFSTTAQGVQPGTGISISRIQVSYYYPGFNLPTFSYGVSYFLPSGDDDPTVTVEDLPIAPVALKKWLLNPANFPENISCCYFSLQARVEVFGATFEGRPLSTEGGLTISFSPGQEEPPPDSS